MYLIKTKCNELKLGFGTCYAIKPVNGWAYSDNDDNYDEIAYFNVR